MTSIIDEAIAEKEAREKDAPLSNGKVLIIEDEEKLAQIYKAALTSEKFQVELASNGKEGIEKAKARKFHVILLDLVMFGIDGFEVLKQWQSDGLLKHTPVIIMSNLDDGESIQRGIELGAVGYFIKSNQSIEEIVNLLKEHINIFKKN